MRLNNWSIAASYATARQSLGGVASSSTTAASTFAATTFRRRRLDICVDNSRHLAAISSAHLAT